MVTVISLRYTLKTQLNNCPIFRKKCPRTFDWAQFYFRFEVQTLFSSPFESPLVNCHSKTLKCLLPYSRHHQVNLWSNDEVWVPSRLFSLRFERCAWWINKIQVVSLTSPSAFLTELDQRFNCTSLNSVSLSYRLIEMVHKTNIIPAGTINHGP